MDAEPPIDGESPIDGKRPDEEEPLDDLEPPTGPLDAEPPTEDEPSPAWRAATEDETEEGPPPGWSLPLDDGGDEEPPPGWRPTLEDEPPIHTPEELAGRRAQERAARRRAGHRRLLALIGAVAVLIVIIVVVVGSGGSKPKTSSSTASSAAAASAAKGVPGYLLVSKDTSALPSNVLIADRNNNRLLSVTPHGQVVWQLAETAPSDAYFSLTGRSAIITEHVESVVLVRGIDSHRINYIYGRRGHTGSTDNHLHDPQTGQEAPNGNLVIADLGNCRVLSVPLTARHHPSSVLGIPGHCVHNVRTTPITFGHPVAAFPTDDGGLVVTELDPMWIDVFGKDGKLVSEVQLSGFTAPSDANEYAPGKVIVTDRAHPGRIVEFNLNSTGTPLWNYAPPSGAGELNRPTVARVLPDGDVLVADSGNNRVIVIDPKTNEIVWQFGHTGRPGSQAGFLHTPDSVDLVPPN